MRLYLKLTGKPLEVGDIVTSFRGEKYYYEGCIPPRHEGSTGRIIVTKHTESGSSNETYYPGVFNAEWRG